MLHVKFENILWIYLTPKKVKIVNYIEAFFDWPFLWQNKSRGRFLTKNYKNYKSKIEIWKSESVLSLILWDNISYEKYIWYGWTVTLLYFWFNYPRKNKNLETFRPFLNFKMVSSLVSNLYWSDHLLLSPYLTIHAFCH
jgi:hypothetical protein